MLLVPCIFYSRFPVVSSAFISDLPGPSITVTGTHSSTLICFVSRRVSGGAQVVIADATATWSSDVTLSVVGVTPTNRSAALPLDILFLAESHSTVATDLERLVKLLPGLVAEVCG